jgi:serine/threonine protein kinase
VAERLTPFGKYFLLERINVGGMAEVFKAKTVGVEGFEKIVAIKRILPSVAEDEEFIRMFVDEAKITSQLSHANLAQTFDLGKVNDAFYIAMEYVPGKDLRAAFERLKRRGERMPLGLCAYILARVCEGLDYAHRKRDLAGRDLHIVHRDVSPQNVILSFEGEVKLIDFGIAKAANKMTKTQAGILKGKFGYMSPEQVRGLPLDGRSDIFAAGIVLYELCTGERLFTGNSDYSVLEKVQQAKVTAPSALEPSIPLKLERIILKALARETDARYQQAADLSADLQRYLIESMPRPVTRDDVAGFMKAMFPDDNAREVQAALESTRPREQRLQAEAAPHLDRKPAPRIKDDQKAVQSPPAAIVRSMPPPLPASLTEGFDAFTDAEDEGVLGEGDTDATFRGPTPVDAPRAEIIVRSRQQSQDLIDPARAEAKTLPPPAFDNPTRPMSMDELAAAERRMLSDAPPSVHVEEESTAPGLPLGGPDEPTPVERPFSLRTGAPFEPRLRAPPVLPPPPVAPPLPLVQVASQPPDREEAEEPELDATEPEATRPEATRPDAQLVEELLARPAAAARERAMPGGAPGESSTPAAAVRDSATPKPASSSGPRPTRPESPLARARAGTETPPYANKALPLPVQAPEERTEPGPAPELPQPRRRGAGRRSMPPPRAELPRRAEPAPPPAPLALPALPAQAEEEIPVSLDQEKTAVRPRPRPEPYGGRMALSRPTLIGEDPAVHDESTVSRAGRSRWIRRAQLAVVAVALGVAVWALVSSPRGPGGKHAAPEAQGVASLKVVTDPPDAVLLLDGQQVKGEREVLWSEPGLPAGIEHVLTARHEGFADKSLTVNLKPGEESSVTLQLVSAAGDLIVRSSPPGAQVFVDGERKGVTPAYLPGLDAAHSHAVSLEKKCFRSWQVAVPAHAGRRELAATLEPAAAACPGRRLEKSEGMPAPEVPGSDDGPASTLGFLSLGSRPAANVIIDGVDIGRMTPLLSWPLQPGSHRLRVVAAGRSKDLPVEIRSGETHSEIVELGAAPAPARGGARKRGRR